MNMIERAKNILLQPKQEWRVVEREHTSAAELYTSYILFLAAIGPLASIVGLSLVGMKMPFVGTVVRVPLDAAITQAVVSYALTLVGIYILASIINVLAPTFRGQKNMDQAMKVATYASTAAWLGGIFTLVPMLSVLVLFAALYSVYLLYLGLPILMKSAISKSVAYTASVIVCAIVLFVAIGAVSSALITYPVQTADQTKVEQAAKQFEDAANSLQKALDQGAGGSSKPDEPSSATAKKTVEPVDFRQLKDLLPDTLAGMTRTKATGERTGAFGMDLSKAEGRYEHDDRGINVEISDIGSLTGLTGMAAYAWASTEVDRETETGIEKTTKINGHKAFEKYDKDSKSGEISVMVSNRFVVEVKGENVKIDDLRSAVGKINLAKLAAL
jgi:hypothetical protein